MQVLLNNGSIKNRTIFCHDNLEILRGIDSDCVDLIYLDPPFNKKKVFTSPIGKNAVGASFSDIFREEDVKDEWLQDIKEEHYFIHNLLSTVKVIEGRASYNFCYLAYMAIRLIECQRVLKPTGSIYLHCDPTMSHYLKLLLDCIFGEANFRNEIIWHYRRWTAGNKNFQRMHDIIFRYSKSDNFVFNVQYEPYGDWIKKDYNYTDKDGRRWRWHTVKGKRYKVYLEDPDKGVKLNDVWQIPYLGSTAKERTGYPTQKPLALLERIITASCVEGGVVLDPFCGCATTCVAAEKLDRRWVGVDVSIKAYELVETRMEKEVVRKGEFKSLQKEVYFETSPPVRTGADTRVQKYVYIISNPQYENYFKVGIASDPKRRLNSYQTSDPKRGYVLEYSFETPNFREIESYIHNDIYKSPHEWVFETDMQNIIRHIEGFNNGE